MRGLQRLRKSRKSGMSLVEMVVTLLIFGIMMTMMVGVLSPAAKIFIRIQKLQYAQIILDNTIQELRGMTRDATGHVKIYEKCGSNDGLADQTGRDFGQGLEFVNEDGYVVLISTEGCPSTGIYRGSQLLSTVNLGYVPAGRLFARYYVREKDAKYHYEDASGQPIARAVSSIFTDGYYMGNYLEIIFSYPPSAGPDEVVDYLEAEVRIYGDEQRNELVVKESVVLDLRYEVKRQDGITANRMTP